MSHDASKGKIVEGMKKKLQFDYEKFEKLQSEARQRSNRVNIDKFDKKTRKSSTLIKRHKTAWTESWERISMDEVALTEEIYHANLRLIMTSPVTSFTLNVSRTDTSEQHRQMAKRLGYLEEELFCELIEYKETNNERVVSHDLMNAVMPLSSNLLPVVYTEISANLFDLTDRRNGEFEELNKMTKQWLTFDPLIRQMCAFVDDLWPATQALLDQHKMITNDLKNHLTSNSKRARLELVRADRARLTLRQQRVKCDVAAKQLKREAAAIDTIVGQMHETERERAVQMENKLEALDHFNRHRVKIKEKLKLLGQEREVQMAREEEALREAEVERERMEAQMREKEKGRRTSEKEQIRSWHKKGAQAKAEADTSEQMAASEKRREFVEQLPIMREATRRRESMRQDKLTKAEETRRQREEDEAKRQATLDQLVAQVAPQVDVDPARVISNTENWRHRLGRQDDDKIDLFRFNSYSDRQLMHDGRLKFEILLRQANIPINSYALDKLASFSPATAPRRDNRHTDLFR